MPGNIAANHFMKVLSIWSSHLSECLQVIQNETHSRRFLVAETQKTCMGQQQASMYMRLCSDKDNFFPKSLFQKWYVGHEAKSIWGQRFSIFWL